MKIPITLADFAETIREHVHKYGHYQVSETAMGDILKHWNVTPFENAALIFNHQRGAGQKENLEVVLRLSGSKNWFDPQTRCYVFRQWQKRKFHIGDLLSVTGDILVSPRTMEGVYDIMNFLTGASLYTHQLVVYKDACRAELLRQHPFLEGIDTSDVTRENWIAKMDAITEKHGVEFEVEEREIKTDGVIHDLEKLGVDRKKIVVI